MYIPYKRRAVLITFSLISTFVILRLFLHMSPDTDLDIGGYNIHHIYTGVVIITIFGLPLCLLGGTSRLLDISALGFGSGLSMALDELVYIIVTDGTNSDYLLPVSLLGGVFMVSAAVLWTLVILFIGNYMSDPGSEEE